MTTALEDLNADGQRAMSFDRFAVLEVLNLLAHDYGLYGVKARLDRMGFRCSPLRETLDGLSEDQQDLYGRLQRRAIHTTGIDSHLRRWIDLTPEGNVGWYYMPKAAR